MNQIWSVYGGWALYTQDKEIWMKLKKKEPMATYFDRSGRLFALQYKFEDRSEIEEVLV